MAENALLRHAYPVQAANNIKNIINADMLKHQQASTVDVARHIEKIQWPMQAILLCIRCVETTAINLLSKTADEQPALALPAFRDPVKQD